MLCSRWQEGGHWCLPTNGQSGRIVNSCFPTLWVYEFMGPLIALAPPALRGATSDRAAVLPGCSRAGLVDVAPIPSHRAGWFVFVRLVVGSETCLWPGWPLTPRPFWLSACQWKWSEVLLGSHCDDQHELSQPVRSLWLRCQIKIALYILCKFKGNSTYNLGLIFEISAIISIDNNTAVLTKFTAWNEFYSSK